MKKILTSALISFVIFCLLLVCHSIWTSRHETNCTLLQQTATEPAQVEKVSEAPSLTTPAAGTIPQPVYFEAADAAPAQLTIGSTNIEDGYMFALELTTLGAAVENAKLTEFDNRDPNNPKPMQILSTIHGIHSLANGYLYIAEQRLPLDKLHWKSLGLTSPDPNSQTASFEALITTSAGDDILRILKTYTLTKNSYDLQCDVSLENLSKTRQTTKFALHGPAGIAREGLRQDMRAAVAGFVSSKGQVDSERIAIGKFDSDNTFESRPLELKKETFIWTAVVDKYFAAIVIPQSTDNKPYPDWISAKTAKFYNPDGQKNTDDENIAVAIQTVPIQLDAAAQRSYKFRVYLGPKDIRTFSSNPYYNKLGFAQTIDFRACCCPTSLISPISFAILSAMEWMYKFIPNYGVVIIILVLFIRLLMHPVTKKSQISMSKFSKIAPKMEELKKKYGDDKAELNKRTMLLYKEQGASPIMGFLPMLVQMPIWIALYSAIYSSITLRGAAFLPFWITDLSGPDALITFDTIIVPLLGWHIDSFNLLPLLMGVAMFLQQKMMPKQAAASEQAAQQQKIMMFMMPLMFPIFLYKAPSGLNLYIMASTFAGVIEQHVIRKHIKQREEAEAQGLVPTTSKAGGKFKKKKPKPFFRQ
jgi:YidC/Oxa1 family membrane protein insertase